MHVWVYNYITSKKEKYRAYRIRTTEIGLSQLCDYEGLRKGRLM